VDKKLPVLPAKNNFSSKKSFVDKFSNKKYETEGFNGKNRLRNFFQKKEQSNPEIQEEANCYSCPLPVVKNAPGFEKATKEK